MKTIREQIIERIIAQLESIHTLNGYLTNIGEGRVFRHEPMVAHCQAPAIVVWEMSEIRHRNNFGGTVRTLHIKVEAVVKTEGEHPAIVSNHLLGDIERSLIMGDVSLDELIDDIQDIAATIGQIPDCRELTALPINGEVAIESISAIETFATATLEFEIIYTTEWGNPYQQ